MHILLKYFINKLIFFKIHTGYFEKSTYFYIWLFVIPSLNVRYYYLLINCFLSISSFFTQYIILNGSVPVIIVCSIVLKILSNFRRKPISNPSLGSSGSTVLEKIPVTPKYVNQNQSRFPICFDLFE